MPGTIPSPPPGAGPRIAAVVDASARMSGAERREQILDAAKGVFARSGFAATTDEVARAAGVSQPYVVRLFGSKRDLFLATYLRTSDAVVEAMSAVEAGPDAGDRMADAYVRLLEDRDLLRLLMHGFIAGSDDEVGRAARHCLGEAYRLFLDRTGATPEEGRQFVASGMLINVLLAVDAPGHLGEDAGMDSLLDCVRTSMEERRGA